MTEQTSFAIDNVSEFKRKSIAWANNFDTFLCLDSNNYQLDEYSKIEWCLAIDTIDHVKLNVGKAFEQLKIFRNKKQRWLFGYFAYDLKNEVEKLSSTNKDQLDFPDLFFFEPRYLIFIENKKVVIPRNYPEAFHIFDSIQKTEMIESKSYNISLIATINKTNYLQKVEAIRQKIEEGEVYELNLCNEFYAENVDFDALSFFNQINDISRSPFAAFFKNENQFVISASPERFLAKRNQQLISQPIKGTIKKGKTTEENLLQKVKLHHDRKERAENVMIVDLVRNDLTKSAITGTIKVPELFKIYEFPTINHMISTIIADINLDIDVVEAIKNTFPMGSMTGAPKVKAMELIEYFESSKRGVYSGAIGYFSPDGDFDFNVVIRSLLYNESKKYLSLQVGGAITFDSIPEEEYEEIKTKAKAIIDLLSE